MEIDAASTDMRVPYANLLPIVERLVAEGNECLTGGFVASPDAWQARMARPIDFDLVLTTFRLPPNVDASPEHDSILDRATWCVIEGPGAHAIRLKPRDIRQR